MIRKITLENFMSHGNTVIELADGLTVLTGPNNCGKSALVSALQILAANGRTTHVMRHGSKVCRITVETDDDQTIVWERNKKTVKYTINGEDVHRIGQSVPENLHDALRLDKVTTESGATNNEYDIHFGEQKSPVFLLNESGSRAAAFFASSSDAARLVEMQHNHRTRTTNARREAKRLQSKSERNIARLAAFAPIESISESVKVAEKLEAQIDAQQQQIRTLNTIIGRLQTLTSHVSRWSGELKILASLDQTETTADKLLARVAQYDRLQTWLSRATRQTQIRDLEQLRACRLTPLRPLTVQHPAAALKMLIGRIEETQHRHRIAELISTTCASLAGPPAMQPAEACRQTSKKLAGAIEKQTTAKRAHEVLAGLTAPPPAQDTQGILKRRRQLTTAIKDHAAMKAHLSATDELEAPPSILLTQPLSQTIASLTREQQRRTKIAIGVRCLETLRAIEPPNDSRPLETISKRLKQMVADVRQACVKADEADELKRRHEQLIREFVSENPKCTTCGGSIDPETLMSTTPGMLEHTAGEPQPEPTR